MADNKYTLIDGNGVSSDSIEIHNPNATTFDISGWYLTDDPDEPHEMGISRGNGAGPERIQDCLLR